MQPAIRTDLEIHRRILELIRAGQAATRKELADRLGASASTISLRARELIDAGLLIDEGALDSTGGRPAHSLRLAGSERLILVAELGTSHARLGIAQTDGELIDSRSIGIDVSRGPARVLDALSDAFRSLVDSQPAPRPVGAICVGLPAPIDHSNGSVDMSSRLRGWQRYPIARRLRDAFPVPVLVENDADVIALGEHLAHPGIRHSITVKAGTSVGVGLIIDSRLHRGANGAAGDISHVRMPAFGDLPCACGKSGCLDTVVSGSALARQWSAATGSSQRFHDLLEAASNGEGRAIELLRIAGGRLGEALSAVAGLVNPDAIFIGGLASTSEDFIAAIRASLYSNCHPLITRDLTIDRVSTGADAGIRGAVALGAEALG